MSELEKSCVRVLQAIETLDDDRSGWKTKLRTLILASTLRQRQSLEEILAWFGSDESLEELRDQYEAEEEHLC